MSKKAILSALFINLLDGNDEVEDFMELEETPSSKAFSLACKTVDTFTQHILKNARQSYPKNPHFVPFVEHYHPNTFQIMFRMSRMCFEQLMGTIHMHPSFVKRNQGGVMLDFCPF